MIEKIDNSKIQETLEKASPRQPGPMKSVQKDNADVSVQVNYASLIEQATKPLQTDAEVISQVKKLLTSGQLLSSEKVQEAAKNIVSCGI